jgi:hypothetical protein
MGVPTSVILAETIIQYLEHIVISKILNKHQIVDYYWYVDDILITYNKHNTNIGNTLEEFDTIHPKLKFSMEKEIQNLDLTITKKHNQLTFGIYREPTITDPIIHNDSCQIDQERIIVQEILKTTGTNNKSHSSNKNIKPPSISHTKHKRQNGSSSQTMVQTRESPQNCLETLT